MGIWFRMIQASKTWYLVIMQDTEVGWRFRILERESRRAEIANMQAFYMEWINRSRKEAARD